MRWDQKLRQQLTTSKARRRWALSAGLLDGRAGVGEGWRSGELGAGESRAGACNPAELPLLGVSQTPHTHHPPLPSAFPQSPKAHHSGPSWLETPPNPSHSQHDHGYLNRVGLPASPLKNVGSLPKFPPNSADPSEPRSAWKGTDSTQQPDVNGF